MSPLPAALPAIPPAHLVPVVAPVAATAAPHGWTAISVRTGDTVYALAMKYRTTVGSLVARNQLPAGGELIHPGQRLQVPRSASASAAAKPATSAAARPAAATAYTVRSGDTLWGIAQRHGTGLAALLKLNRLSASSVIHPGQVIRLTGSTAAPARPTPASPSTGSTSTGTYTVRSGDTLGHIAQRAGTSLAALLKLNRMSATTVIHPGQKLRISGSTASAPAQPSTGGSKPTNLGSIAANKAYLDSISVPNRTQTRDLIVAAARRHGVDPSLALAIGWQESGWNQNAVSHANALGVMQVIPLSGTWASELLGRPVDLLDTRDNIEAGVVILRALTRSASSLDIAIASYYQGLHSVTTGGMYTDTKAYVASVKAHMTRM